MVYLLEYDQGVVSSALKGHEDGDVELNRVLGLRIIACPLSFVLPRNDIV